MSSAATPSVAERVQNARLRALSAISHFATSSGTPPAFCERCRKPLNRWDEKCEYALTAEAMLAEDVLFLLGELDEANTRFARALGAEAVDRHADDLRKLADA